MLRRLVTAIHPALVAVGMTVTQSASTCVLHTAIHFTAAATTMSDALLACMCLLGASFHDTEALDHKAAVLQTEATATRMRLTVVGLTLLLSAVAHTQLPCIDLVGAVLDAALAPVLVERALAGAVHCEVVTVVKAALLGLAVRREVVLGGCVAVAAVGAGGRTRAPCLGAHCVL